MTVSVRTSERRIQTLREVTNLLVENHGETRERLIRVEDKLDVVVDQVADLKTDFAEMKTDVADLKTDFAEMKTDFAEMKRLLRDRPP